MEFINGTWYGSSTQNIHYNCSYSARSDYEKPWIEFRTALDFINRQVECSLQRLIKLKNFCDLSLKINSTVTSPEGIFQAFCNEDNTKCVFNIERHNELISSTCASMMENQDLTPALRAELTNAYVSEISKNYYNFSINPCIHDICSMPHPRPASPSNEMIIYAIFMSILGVTVYIGCIKAIHQVIRKSRSGERQPLLD